MELHIILHGFHIVFKDGIKTVSMAGTNVIIHLRASLFLWVKKVFWGSSALKTLAPGIKSTISWTFPKPSSNLYSKTGVKIFEPNFRVLLHFLNKIVLCLLMTVLSQLIRTRAKSKITIRSLESGAHLESQHLRGRGKRIINWVSLCLNKS